MDRIIDKLAHRLDALKEWRERGSWSNPRSASESRGYDAAVDEEIAFLDALLKGADVPAAS